MLMDWYARRRAAGASAEDCLSEARLSLAVAAMDKDVKQALPEIRPQFQAIFSAAKLALQKAGKPWLTALGIDKPQWKEPELDAMRDQILSAFDPLIGQ